MAKNTIENSDLSDKPAISAKPVRTIQEAGLTVEWLYDGRIVVFRLGDVRRQTVDAWSKMVLDEIAKVPLDQPVLFLHDGSKIGITPYLSSKVPELHRRASHLKGRVAIVMSQSIFGQLISRFLQSSYMKDARQVNRGFTSFDKALAWLVEYLPDPSAHGEG